ncbi:hypothetical protein FHS10_002898 [Mucilaginibacter dorajii]|nr:hypothetical protein [Mucilaginibacter dorajii]
MFFAVIKKCFVLLYLKPTNCKLFIGRQTYSGGDTILSVNDIFGTKK